MTEDVRSDEERQRARMEREARRAGRDFDGMYTEVGAGEPRKPGRPRNPRRNVMARRLVALILLAAAALVAWFVISLFEPGKGSGHGSVTVTISPDGSPFARTTRPPAASASAPTIASPKPPPD